MDHDGLPAHRLPSTGSRPITRIAQGDLDGWLQQHRHDPELEKALADKTLTLDGIQFIKPDPPENSKPELDTRRRFRPRVSPKADGDA